MSAVVGELVWKVTGDTSGIDKSLKQTDQKAQGLAGNFKSAMGIMAGAVVGAGIAKKIFDIGKASAIAYILFAIIFLLVLVQWKLRKKMVYNEHE